MQQQIQFVTAPDGVNLAVATMGAGPRLHEVRFEG